MINNYDQHFLIDETIIKKFIKEGNFNKKDIVVEIGPGKGTISSLIAKEVYKLYCIEIDENLKQYLDNLPNNVEIIYENVLNVHIPNCSKIIGALPYRIIEPFINKIVKCKFKESILIIGKKYADNVLNKKITKLSLLTNCYFETKKIIDITPDSFNPKPRVMSSMIKLIPIDKKNLNFNDQLFRYMFYFKNKIIKNALMESLIRTYEDNNKTLTKKQSKDIIKNYNINNELLEKNLRFVLMKN